MIIQILLDCANQFTSQEFSKLIRACASNVDIPNECLELVSTQFSSLVSSKYLSSYFVKMSYNLTLELIEEAKAFRQNGSGISPLLNIKLKVINEGMNFLSLYVLQYRAKLDCLPD